MKITTPKKLLNIAYDETLTKEETDRIREMVLNCPPDVKVDWDDEGVINIEAEEMDEIFHAYEQVDTIFSQGEREYRAGFCADVDIDLEEEDSLDFMGKYIKIPGELSALGIEVKFIYEENERILIVHMGVANEKTVQMRIVDVVDEKWKIQTSYAAMIAAVHKITKL